MRWHRDFVARSWTFPRHGRAAPNALDVEVVALVLGLARENRRWGYLRIVGERRKLGVTVSATTVRNVLRRHRLKPAPRSGPSWSEFLRAQAGGTLSCDFFHVDTVMLRRVCVLFFIDDIDRRKVFLASVTTNPVGPWVTQQARNLVATLEDQGRALRFLVRDRDAKFVGPFDEVLRSVGARIIKTPVRSPQANSFAERFCSLHELSAWTGCWSGTSATSTWVLREFVAHYNGEHRHRGINLEVPIPYVTDHQFTGVSNLKRADRLGGLIHDYRVAA